MDPRADIDPYEAAVELLGRCDAMISRTKSADEDRRVVWNGNVLEGGERAVARSGRMAR